MERLGEKGTVMGEGNGQAGGKGQEKDRRGRREGNGQGRREESGAGKDWGMRERKGMTLTY